MYKNALNKSVKPSKHGIFIAIKKAVAFAAKKGNLMQLRYYGHSCVGLFCGDDEIIVDPFITPNPQAANINTNTIKAKWVLVTHAHQDHIADVALFMEQNDATLVCNYEIANWYKKQGFSKVQAMNIGGTFMINNTAIYMCSAAHTSSFEDGTYGGSAVGFVISFQNKNCYVAGDTGLSMEMNILPQKFKLHASLLPIGDTYTMGYKDALIASEWLQTEKTIGVHYNSFEALAIDTDAAKQYFKEHNSTLTLMEVGQTIEI